MPEDEDLPLNPVDPQIPGQPDTLNQEGPNTYIRDQFAEYCSLMKAHSAGFTKTEVIAIELLDLLRKQNAPLNAYDDLMLWHLKRSGLAFEHETKRNCSHFIGRSVVLQMLEQRYNLANKKAVKTKIKLPNANATQRFTKYYAMKNNR